MDLEIRNASPDDAALTALLGRITFRETFGYLFERHESDLRAYLDKTFAVAKFRASLVKPMNTYWLASCAGLPVAYAKLKFPLPTPVLVEPCVALLQKIYVLREFIGQGIGAPLLEVVLNHATCLGAKAVWLNVLKANARAIRFYLDRGFAPMGENTHTVGAQNFAFDVMVLQLAPAAT
jgi:diamine N-acetyltransferase